MVSRPIGLVNKTFFLKKFFLECLVVDRYHNYTQLMEELDNLAENYPDISSLYSLGQTHEERDLTVIQISQGVKKVSNENLNAVLLISL